jgi:hypothetical protein
MNDPSSSKRQNRLAKEKSPYLLQHAENPVDWYPWGPEAFEAARKLDKPIFLSIGYSTCHWCHVMAHESFGDPEVAKLLNDAFVCVKVDRTKKTPGVISRPISHWRASTYTARKDSRSLFLGFLKLRSISHRAPPFCRNVAEPARGRSPVCALASWAESPVVCAPQSGLSSGPAQESTAPSYGDPRISRSSSSSSNPQGGENPMIDDDEHEKRGAKESTMAGSGMAGSGSDLKIQNKQTASSAWPR